MNTMQRPTVLLSTLFVTGVAFIIAWLIMQMLASYPMTDHALTSHAQEKWNAVSILTAQNTGKCGTVKSYVCPDDTIVRTCVSPDNSSQMLGLVIGATDQQIITGYTGRAAHWNGKTQRCKFLGMETGVTP